MTPHTSFHCKLVPVQFREYKYGLLLCTETNTCTNTLNETGFSCTFEGRGAIQISNHNANKTEQVLKPLTAGGTVGFLKIHTQLTQCIEYF